MTLDWGLFFRDLARALFRSSSVYHPMRSYNGVSGALSAALTRSTPAFSQVWKPSLSQKSSESRSNFTSSASASAGFAGAQSALEDNSSKFREEEVRLMLLSPELAGVDHLLGNLWRNADKIFAELTSELTVAPSALGLAQSAAANIGLLRYPIRGLVQSLEELQQLSTGDFGQSSFDFSQYNDVKRAIVLANKVSISRRRVRADLDRASSYLQALTPAIFTLRHLSRERRSNMARWVGKLDDMVVQLQRVDSLTSDESFNFANFSNLDISYADLNEVNLNYSSFAGANLTGLRLRSASLISAMFAGANLSHAQLQHANLHRARMEGAMLQGVSFHFANLTAANLDGAELHIRSVLNARWSLDTVWPNDIVKAVRSTSVARDDGTFEVVESPLGPPGVADNSPQMR